MDYLKSIGFQSRTYEGWHAKVLILGMEKIFDTFEAARAAQAEIAKLCRENAPELIGCRIEAVEGDFSCWYYI